MAANKVSIDLELKGDKLVERGLKNVGDAADKAGDEFTGMAKDAGHLTTKISETEAEIKKLTKAFNDTGDMDLLKKIRKEKSNLRALTGLLPSPAEAVKEAAEVGSKAGIAVSSALTDAIRHSKGILIPPLIAVVAAAAPAIGAGIAGAVVGAAGVGGIVGGIVAAAQDQRIQDAARMVGDRFTSALTDAGSPFVGPLLESLRVLDGAGERFAANFAEAGKKIAPVLVPLTEGVAGLVDEAMPGIVRAMEAAKPAIRAIAAELPKIGASVSDFFDKLSEDPDEVVAGIVGISQAIQGVIRISGSLIDSLGGIYEWSTRVGASISGTMETLFGWMPIAGGVLKEQGAAYRERAEAIEHAKNASKDYVGEGAGPIIRAEEEITKVTKTATEAIEDQIKAMDKMVGRVLDAQELTSDYEEAVDKLTESVKKNGTSLDLGTEKGRANAAAMRDQVEAITAVAKDIYSRTGDINATNAAFEQMIESQRKQAIQLGMNKKAVDEFVAALREAQRRWDVEVRAPGLLDALERARELNHLLGSISAGARVRGGDTSGFGGGRAGGGPMDAGKWYTVGENGVEVVSMHPGGGATVYNSKQTGAMMSGASGGSAMALRPVVNMTFVPSGNAAWDALIQAIWPSLLKQVRLDGGDLTAFGATA